VKDINDYHAEAAATGKSIDFHFGVLCSVCFFALSLIPLIKGNGIRLWALYAGIIFLVISVLYPVVLIPLRKLWIKFGVLIQKIMQPFILGIIFYTLFTPIGVVMRCFGKDPLLLKKRSGVISYWKLRDLHQANVDMKNQF